MFGHFLDNVRTKQPHIHCITNYVTINDCANILLACGGSPIMAEYTGEVEEITALCDGLLLNLGMLNPDKLTAMQKAGTKANELHHPIVFDPVGVGASAFRTNSAKELLKQVQVQAIRGNFSEIKALFQHVTVSHGVDAVSTDNITKANLSQIVPIIKHFAEEADCIIAVTGEMDIVADSAKAYCIANGHSLMKAVTGSGCQLSALTSAYLTANRESPLEAVTSAMCAMGICGEIAFSHLKDYEGNSTYRNYLIDAVYRLDSETLDKMARYEIL